MTEKQGIEMEVTLKDIPENYQEAYKKGYLKGYSDKRTAVRQAKKEAEKAYHEQLASLEITTIYPFNLIYEIEEENQLDDDKLDIRAFSPELIQMQLATLTIRENRCLEMMYRDHMTLDQIGKEFDVTRERIRQIIAKAKRKLKHPIRRRSMLACPQNEYDDLIARYQKLEDEYKELFNMRVSEGLIDISEYEDDHKELLDKGIIELDLSVRSYNCLCRAGINTVRDLTNITLEDAIKIRNLGRRSLNEIRDKLMDYGLYFRYDDGGEI